MIPLAIIASAAILSAVVVWLWARHDKVGIVTHPDPIVLEQYAAKRGAIPQVKTDDLTKQAIRDELRIMSGSR